MRQKRVLLISDLCCVGQCSISVALPVLSACGVEVCALPVTLLSTHSVGFYGYTKLDLAAEGEKILRHIKSEGIGFDCVYIGYLGGVGQAELAEHAISMFSDGALTVVDPAMADFGEFYPGLDEAYARRIGELCRRADIILPNVCEARILANAQGLSAEELAARLKRQFGAEVVVTGAEFAGDASPDCAHCANNCGAMTGAVYTENGGINAVKTAKVDRVCHGAGDVFKSAFTGAVLNGATIGEAAKIACDFVFDSVLNTLSEADHAYGLNFESCLPKLITAIRLLPKDRHLTAVFR